jgi:hypothetical protein
MQHQLEKRLKDLRPGALFTTRSGAIAVKSAYSPEGQCQCVLLETGESIYFQEGDMTPVREVELEGQSVASEPEHEHTFTIAASNSLALRMCTTCGMAWMFDSMTVKGTRLLAQWHLIEEPEESP